MIGGLIAVGLVVWLVAAAGGAVALPWLVSLVCPLSMGIMAWQMRRGGSFAAPDSGGGASQAASGAMTGERKPAGEGLAIERARDQLAARDDQLRA